MCRFSSELFYLRGDCGLAVAEAAGLLSAVEFLHNTVLDFATLERFSTTVEGALANDNAWHTDSFEVPPPVDIDFAFYPATAYLEQVREDYPPGYLSGASHGQTTGFGIASWRHWVTG